MKLKIKKLSEHATIPQRATDGSVGYDLYACLEDVNIKKIIIRPGETVKIKTGISIEIKEKNVGGFVFARSGLATNYGIVPANCVGVIDNDYRGEIIVPLKNCSNLDYEVFDQERIAQIIFLPTVIFDDVVITDDLSHSERGFGGFGSTGKS